MEPFAVRITPGAVARAEGRETTAADDEAAELAELGVTTAYSRAFADGLLTALDSFEEMVEARIGWDAPPALFILRGARNAALTALEAVTFNRLMTDDGTWGTVPPGEIMAALADHMERSPCACEAVLTACAQDNRHEPLVGFLAVTEGRILVDGATGHAGEVRTVAAVDVDGRYYVVQRMRGGGERREVALYTLAGYRRIAAETVSDTDARALLALPECLPRVPRALKRMSAALWRYERGEHAGACHH